MHCNINRRIDPGLRRPHTGTNTADGWTWEPHGLLITGQAQVNLVLWENGFKAVSVRYLLRYSDSSRLEKADWRNEMVFVLLFTVKNNSQFVWGSVCVYYNIILASPCSLHACSDGCCVSCFSGRCVWNVSLIMNDIVSQEDRSLRKVYDWFGRLNFGGIEWENHFPALKLNGSGLSGEY